MGVWGLRPQRVQGRALAFLLLLIRRVLPGDHKEKLSAKAIAQLNAMLAPSMRLFGYGA